MTERLIALSRAPRLDDLGPAGARPQFHIGAVAERTQLSHATLRHWDEAGVVSPAGRTDGGFRLYSEADIQRILVVRRMKPLGFTLEQMRQIIDSFDTIFSPDATAAQRQAARSAMEECCLEAQGSLERIRKHLFYAEEFVQLLTELIDTATPEA